MKWYIWHNTRGTADQYFVCKGNKVKFGIPRFLGRILKRQPSVFVEET